MGLVSLESVEVTKLYQFTRGGWEVEVRKVNNDVNRWYAVAKPINKDRAKSYLSGFARGSNAWRVSTFIKELVKEIDEEQSL